MKKMIDEFIEQNIEKDGFKDYLIKSFSPILKDYYLENDSETYERLIDKEKQQQLLHEFMEKECVELFKFCEKNDVNIIGLKGIFLEKQFWKQPRFYNDIDVIIHKEDIKKLYDYFLNIGTYKVIKKRNINPFQKNISLSSMLNVNLDKVHHVVLWKESEELLLSGINHIEIEVHGSFDTFKIVDIDDESMFNDSVIFDDFRVLDSESSILFLIYHTVQHLPYIRHDLSSLYIKIDRFVDVAYIIFNGGIDWSKFEKLSILHSMSPLCAFYFKMFNEIFPKVVPGFVIENIKSESENMDFKWKKTYLRLMKMNSLDLIIGNFNDFPEIEKPYLKIRKYILRERFNNKYILKFAMELWKIKLSNIHSNLE